MAVRWLYHRSCESRHKSRRLAWDKRVGGGSKRNGARAAHPCRRRSCAMPTHPSGKCARNPQERTRARAASSSVSVFLSLLLRELVICPLVVVAKRESRVLSPRAPQFRRKGTASGTWRTHLRPAGGYHRHGRLRVRPSSRPRCAAAEKLPRIGEQKVRERPRQAQILRDASIRYGTARISHG
jgi:hypothetical protein